MLRARDFLLAGAALVTLSTAGSAQEDSWYFGAGVGASWLAETTSTLPAFPGNDAEFEYDTGWSTVAALGYKGSNFRLEFELGYRGSDSESVTAPLPNTLFSDVTYFTQMVNLVLDVPLGEHVSLSLGGGAGGAEVQYDMGGIYGLSLLSIDDSDYVFAYQGIAGLSVDVSPQMEMFAEYRYFGTDDFQAIGSPPPVGGEFVEGDPESHTALFGVRYFFNAEEEVAQPLEPAAPPPPEPAAVPKTYIVFFDFNKSSLNAEAQSVIAEAADAFKSTGAAHVMIVGHTDTVGKKAYNQRLSERRAKAVKDQMVSLGVSADDITTEGRGFTELLVPTGAGAREARNRRAVIELMDGKTPQS